MVTLLGPFLLKKTVEEVEPQAEGNHITTSNGLDIMSCLKGDVIENYVIFMICCICSLQPLYVAATTRYHHVTLKF